MNNIYYLEFYIQELRNCFILFFFLYEKITRAPIFKIVFVFKEKQMELKVVKGSHRAWIEFMRQFCDGKWNKVQRETPPHKKMESFRSRNKILFEI